MRRVVLAGLGQHLGGVAADAEAQAQAPHRPDHRHPAARSRSARPPAATAGCLRPRCRNRVRRCPPPARRPSHRPARAGPAGHGPAPGWCERSAVPAPGQRPAAAALSAPRWPARSSRGRPDRAQAASFCRKVQHGQQQHGLGIEVVGLPAQRSGAFQGCLRRQGVVGVVGQDAVLLRPVHRSRRDLAGLAVGGQRGLQVTLFGVQLPEHVVGVDNTAARWPAGSRWSTGAATGRAGFRPAYGQARPSFAQGNEPSRPARFRTRWKPAPPCPAARPVRRPAARHGSSPAPGAETGSRTSSARRHGGWPRWRRTPGSGIPCAGRRRPAGLPARPGCRGG